MDYFTQIRLQIKWILEQIKCLKEQNCECEQNNIPPEVNQNNKIVSVDLGSDYDGTPLEQLVLVINDTNGFTVDEDENFIFNLTPDNDEPEVIYQFLFKLGKGTWGNGGTPVTENDFVELIQNNFILTGNTDSPLADNGIDAITVRAKQIAAYEQHLEFIDSLVEPNTSTLKITDDFINSFVQQNDLQDEFESFLANQNIVKYTAPNMVAGRIPYTTGTDIVNTSSKFLWDNINSLLEINGNLVALKIKETLNNKYVTLGNPTFGNGSLAFKNQDGKTLAYLLNPTSLGTAQFAIGNVTSIPAESQFYVYGGNNGANIDMRGKPSADETNMDFEGADWETFPNSLGFSYFGNQYASGGDILSYPKLRLGHIRFNNSDYAIFTTFNDSVVVPFRFGINDVEIANLNDKGWSYQADFSIDNVSNPRWLTDKEYVDNGLSLKYDASNPLSFETTTQLNIRDTNNRARANHTGTQLAATISDFTTASRTAVVDNSITSGVIDKAPSEDAVMQYVDKPAYRSVSSATNLLITDKTLNISSGTFTVGMVTAVGNAGITFRVINNGSGIITLDPNASETINGSSTLIIPSETGVVIESDGTNWIIVGKHRLQTLHRTQWIQPIALTTIANGASLNLFTLISDANKSANGTDGGTYDLSIATDKILTQWHGEKMTHHIRVSSTIVTGTDQHYILTLRRYADNSVLGQVQLNRNADTGLFTADFLTYTYSDVDPFVTGGFYIALDNNSGAGVDITGSINLLVVTYFK